MKGPGFTSDRRTGSFSQVIWTLSWGVRTSLTWSAVAVYWQNVRSVTGTFQLLGSSNNSDLERVPPIIHCLPLLYTEFSCSRTNYFTVAYAKNTTPRRVRYFDDAVIFLGNVNHSKNYALLKLCKVYFICLHMRTLWWRVRLLRRHQHWFDSHCRLSGFQSVTPPHKAVVNQQAIFSLSKTKGVPHTLQCPPLFFPSFKCPTILQLSLIQKVIRYPWEKNPWPWWLVLRAVFHAASSDSGLTYQSCWLFLPLSVSQSYHR